MKFLISILLLIQIFQLIQSNTNDKKETNDLVFVKNVENEEQVDIVNEEFEGKY
jgi:thioredoxin-related protein